MHQIPAHNPCQCFSKFECNIYSDIDFQSAIPVTSTGNSRSFTELTDRLAFVNFSSPGADPDQMAHYVASDLGLHFLPIPLRGFQNKMG